MVSTHSGHFFWHSFLNSINTLIDINSKPQSIHCLDIYFKLDLSKPKTLTRRIHLRTTFILQPHYTKFWIPWCLILLNWRCRIHCYTFWTQNSSVQIPSKVFLTISSTSLLRFIRTVPFRYIQLQALLRKVVTLQLQQKEVPMISRNEFYVYANSCGLISIPDIQACGKVRQSTPYRLILL